MKHFDFKLLKILYLTFQFNPGALLLGLQLFSLVFFDTLEEAVPALWVLHVLNAHVDPLGQDLSPVTFGYNFNKHLKKTIQLLYPRDFITFWNKAVVCQHDRFDQKVSAKTARVNVKQNNFILKTFQYISWYSAVSP